MKPIFVDIGFHIHIYSQKYRFANKYGYAYFSPILLYDNNLYRKLQLEIAVGNCRHKLHRAASNEKYYQISGFTSVNIPAFFFISCSLPMVQTFSSGSAICSNAAQS